MEEDGLPGCGRNIVLISSDVTALTPLHKPILYAINSSTGISEKQIYLSIPQYTPSISQYTSQYISVYLPVYLSILPVYPSGT